MVAANTYTDDMVRDVEIANLRTECMRWASCQAGAHQFSSMVADRLLERTPDTPISVLDQIVASAYDTHLKSLSTKRWWALGPDTMHNISTPDTIDLQEIHVEAPRGFIALLQPSPAFPQLRAATWSIGTDRAQNLWMQATLLKVNELHTDPPLTPYDFSISKLDTDSKGQNPVLDALMALWSGISRHTVATKCVHHFDRSVVRHLI